MIEYIEVTVDDGTYFLYANLKDAFERFRKCIFPKKKLHIYYSDGKNLQFFVNREGYFEVETLNWK